VSTSRAGSRGERRGRMAGSSTSPMLALTLTPIRPPFPWSRETKVHRSRNYFGITVSHLLPQFRAVFGPRLHGNILAGTCRAAGCLRWRFVCTSFFQRKRRHVSPQCLRQRCKPHRARVLSALTTSCRPVCVATATGGRHTDNSRGKEHQALGHVARQTVRSRRRWAGG
jgi:hypothetical protein